MIKIGDCFKEERAWFCVTKIDSGVADVVTLWVAGPEPGIYVSISEAIYELVEGCEPVSRTEFDREMLRTFDQIRHGLPKAQSSKTKDRQPEDTK